MLKDSMRLEIDVNIEGKLINLGCDGYKSWWTEHKEDRYSALPGQKYKLFNRIIPREGDVWQYGTRTFVVGKKSGFVIYTMPLLENGIEVATIQFEDYYKD
jgi:hypothetical protein